MITAVNNVSYRNNYNYYNLSFGSNKKQRAEHEPRHSSSVLKAIPLATLIAMSPLNAPSATYDFDQNPEKIVLQTNFVDRYTNQKFQLFFYDTDGDENTAEKIQVGTFNVVRKNQRDIETRKSVPVEFRVVNEVRLDTLKQVNVTTKYESGSKSTNHTEFYIVGEGKVVQSPMIAQDGSGKEIRPKKTERSHNCNLKIPQDLYQYLDEITNGSMPKKVENRVDFVSSEDEYLYGM